MVNKLNINLVIQSIRGDIMKGDKRVGFSMNTYCSDPEALVVDMTGHNCGTVACVAGHAYLLEMQNDITRAKAADCDEIEDVAATFLGIEGDDAAHLFYDLPVEIDLQQVAPEMAIETLTRLAETGRVEWTV